MKLVAIACVGAMATGGAWSAAAQTIRLVNMVPAILSGESNTDSEPNVSVNPRNTSQVAGSAFTPNPAGSGNAPIYVSNDGGQTWALNAIVPGGNRLYGTGDITLRFASASNVLYASVLRGDSRLRMNILRTPDFLGSTPMEVLVPRNNVDQPYVQALSTVKCDELPVRIRSGISLKARYKCFSPDDHVWVGNNNLAFSQSTGKTASIDSSQSAATAAAPGGFTTSSIEPRATAYIEGDEVTPDSTQDGPSVRPAPHPDGTVYGAYFGWRTFGRPTISDIVVVRDDNFGASATPFAALLDPVDGLIGIRVATGISIPRLHTKLGNQRIGSHLTIAVDPKNSRRVFIAWADGTSADDYTIRVRRSVDGGATWSSDLRTVLRAINPALAIDERGRVGLLYQQRVEIVNRAGTVEGHRWEAHVEITSNEFASHKNILLHSARDDVGDHSGAGPFGDYADLHALGNMFYGVFTGSNAPIRTNFPQGVQYQRNVNFDTQKLLDTDGGREVSTSTDPYFFTIAYRVTLPPCFLGNSCKIPDMRKGYIILKCEIRGCTLVDPIPKNCLVKYSCPGCSSTGPCPPYYHVYLEGLSNHWNVGLFDDKGEPVPHSLYPVLKGVVLSFQPDRQTFQENRIGNYVLGFELDSKGKVGQTYKVRARLERSDAPYTASRFPSRRR